MKVVKITIKGTDAAAAVAHGLAKVGVWFSCTPLANGEFEFCVKAGGDAWFLPTHQNGRALRQVHFELTETWAR